jgi:hypothetical protein
MADVGHVAKDDVHANQPAQPSHESSRDYSTHEKLVFKGLKHI